VQGYRETPTNEKGRLPTMELSSNTSDVRHLEGVPFTMLSPLFSRANVDTIAPKLGFSDPLAKELLQRLRYKEELMPLDRGTLVGNAVRAHMFDRNVAAFLHRFPDATVVQLGVGLDTRKQRLAAPRARWVAVDLPEVMAIRDALLPDPQECRISADLRSESWLEAAFAGTSPRAVFFSAEGLFYYLNHETVHAMMHAINARFANTGVKVELCFDYYHPYFCRQGKQKAVERTCTRLSWGVSDPRMLCPDLKNLEFYRVETLRHAAVPLQVRIHLALLSLRLAGKRPYGIATYRLNTESM
jgi:O-methyltransferase involved in polyketide biosynthesis